MAATAAASDHPNIVRLIGICEEDNTIYIVMDRAEGRCAIARLVGCARTRELHARTTRLPNHRITRMLWGRWFRR